MAGDGVTTPTLHARLLTNKRARTSKKRYMLYFVVSLFLFSFLARFGQLLLKPLLEVVLDILIIPTSVVPILLMQPHRFSPFWFDFFKLLKFVLFEMDLLLRGRGAHNCKVCLCYDKKV
eukprot:GEMP01112996.1.p1 GENE.GEMP01112996.1~~GEMP01112996.1.p1  ORF type:complete len:119 (-),score=1.48 GEMP01112996.1:31-387(-)